MSITIEKSGFSTMGMFGNNHRLIYIDGNPLFYTCTAFDDNDHRIFVLKTNRQLMGAVEKGVRPSFSWIEENIEILIDAIEKKNPVYVYCKTTTGMIIRPNKESFFYSAPRYDAGHSNDSFDPDLPWFEWMIDEIIKNEDINSFWFVDSITGKEVIDV